MLQRAIPDPFTTSVQSQGWVIEYDIPKVKQSLSAAHTHLTFVWRYLVSQNLPSLGPEHVLKIKKDVLSGLTLCENQATVLRRIRDIASRVIAAQAWVCEVLSGVFHPELLATTEALHHASEALRGERHRIITTSIKETYGFARNENLIRPDFLLAAAGEPTPDLLNQRANESFEDGPLESCQSSCTDITKFDDSSVLEAKPVADSDECCFASVTTPSDIEGTASIDHAVLTKVTPASVERCVEMAVSDLTADTLNESFEVARISPASSDGCISGVATAVTSEISVKSTAATSVPCVGNTSSLRAQSIVEQPIRLNTTVMAKSDAPIATPDSIPIVIGSAWCSKSSKSAKASDRTALDHISSMHPEFEARQRASMKALVAEPETDYISKSKEVLEIMADEDLESTAADNTSTNKNKLNVATTKCSESINTYDSHVVVPAVNEKQMTATRFIVTGKSTPIQMPSVETKRTMHINEEGNLLALNDVSYQF